MLPVGRHARAEEEAAVMIENAWDEYRAWAKRARELQGSSRSWNGLALAFAVLAAVLAVAAAQATTGVWWGRVLAFLAAAAAAVTPVLGQDILAVGREADWIRARATAEALKGECFRVAGQVGAYAGTYARDTFVARRDALEAPARQANLTPLSDPVGATGDPRRPNVPVDSSWYLQRRLRDQKTFYANRQIENEHWVARLRAASLGAAVLAALLGVASATLDLPSVAPWIGVMTTLGAMVIAYGLMERSQYLAASYGAMVGALGRIEEQFAAGGLDVAWLVGTTEDLLISEHTVWIERMTKTIPAPPPAPRPSAATAD
jgi:hypothetical protein